MIEWLISSFCESGSCVAVGFDDGNAIVRHSDLGGMVELTFSAQAWQGFIDGVKAGEFDVPKVG